MNISRIWKTNVGILAKNVGEMLEILRTFWDILKLFCGSVYNNFTKSENFKTM